MRAVCFDPEGVTRECGRVAYGKVEPDRRGAAETPCPREAQMGASEKLMARVDTLSQGAAFSAYEQVRERVLLMKDRERAGLSSVSRPSDYWREELANFEYMLDASPLIIDKLRHHCYHITGLRVYDYRSNRDEARELFEEKLGALIKVGGADLLVPEAPDLGGFGFEIDRALYNLDTLKFYEALIALKNGAVLSDFLEGNERRVVWEIGAGWGGFAYQFKTLCPNVTYIVSDLPELFLFSAVYLMSAFPDATVRFLGDGSPGDSPDDWCEADFVFVPNTMLDAVSPERLDLVVNMVSFQEMTSQQVRNYVNRAYDLGSPYLYSLNRERSAYNRQLSGVRPIIQECFWPHEIPVLPVPYTQMLGEAGLSKSRGRKLARLLRRLVGEGKPDPGYKHTIGWRRVSA